MVEFRTISLSAIDLADQRFRITRAGEDSQALALSISRIGMTTPPSVIEKTPTEKTDKGFTIVSGFKRVEACRSLGHDQILCRVWQAKEAGEGAKAAVAENAFGRQLSSAQTIQAVVLLSRYMSAGEIAALSSELFNTPLNPAYVEGLISISGIGPLALDLLESGQLALKTAKAMAKMEEQEVRELLLLFSKVKASSGKQTDILTWSREIAARESLSLNDLFKEEAIQQALAPSGGNQDLAAAANRVRACLYARRYPELSAARNRAAEHIREMKLPRNIRILPPEHFESTVTTVQIQISSLEEYRLSLSALSGLATHSALQKLLDR